MAVAHSYCYELVLMYSFKSDFRVITLKTLYVIFYYYSNELQTCRQEGKHIKEGF